MPRFLIVRPVEGKRLLDIRTLGALHHHIGHERKVVGVTHHPLNATKLPSGQYAYPIDKIEHVFADIEEAVPEPSADNYFRTAVLDGDLDYVATVEADDSDAALAKNAKRLFEKDLVRATAVNKATREHHAALAKAGAEALQKAEDDALAEARAAGDAHTKALAAGEASKQPAKKPDAKDAPASAPAAPSAAKS